jgi:hypothetical protein
MKSINDKAPEALAKLQSSFAAHIRDPETTAAPDGIEDRRMAIYRDLFFNNIKSFLASNFPVLRTLYSNEQWSKLCRDFYRDYRCHTPLFPEIPKEFLRYLQSHRVKHESDPPFMQELAHYEWVELGLALDEADPGTMDVNETGDLLLGIPVLSPLVWSFSYTYPVHQIRAEYQPEEPPDETTNLLIWRRHDFEIKFMQLNTVSLLLIEKLKEDAGNTGLELLTSIAGIIQHPKPEKLIEAGSGLLQELREKQILLGTRP